MLDELLDALEASPSCELLPPAGQPDVGFALPDDLTAFYERCGGARMFIGYELEWPISGPNELVPAAPRLRTVELAAELDPDEVAATCFVFADEGGGSTDRTVVVDLHPDRLGRYIETFWDRFGWRGDMPVIGLSLFDALTWLTLTEGEDTETAFEKRPIFGDHFEL